MLADARGRRFAEGLVRVTGRVLIVGGGIAGLSLACALRQRGVSFVVVERQDATRSAGLGLNLPGNAIQALLRVDPGGDITRRGMPIQRREYRNAKGRLLFAVDEAAFWANTVTSRCVRRGDLLDLLRAGAPPESIRWNSTVTHVEPTPEHVEVRFDDDHTETYDLVVGADGVHSAVRQALLGRRDSRPAPLTTASWRFVIPATAVRCWSVWLGSDATFLVIPVDADHVYGFASATRGGPVGSDPRWLASTFARYADPVPHIVAAALAEPSLLHHSPMQEVRAKRWSYPRTVLIGDAAHATAPIWAQGAALAIEDALVLAELLATGGDWADIGAEYERRRRPRVNHVQTMTDRATLLAGLPAWLRDVLVPAIGPHSYRQAYGPLRQPVV
jgi:2-polyprenyl-6-methoxyphenol hydroxylase-like FAD-dependent oxidoreductase